MTDRDFDQLLYQGADQLPPKSVEQTSPDPWRQALLLICWGIALTSITLNFLNLQYILPAVGAMLLCLGFRSLRRENGWFRQCYVLSILLALYRGATDLLLATPLAADLSGGWSYLLGLLGWLVSLWLLFALWRALKAVFLRAELPAKTRAAGEMVICYFLLFLLALVNASGWLLLLPVLILWICLLTGLFKTSRALDHAVRHPARPGAAVQWEGAGRQPGGAAAGGAGLPIDFQPLPGGGLPHPVGDWAEGAAAGAAGPGLPGGGAGRPHRPGGGSAGWGGCCHGQIRPFPMGHQA